ncbi:hypothetical protein NDU88_003085 [Pleurodeles waltl]|uniref:Uncharacterized protein n=1 Tax=Pleurodeles waltl TaxID=8319 RepID=A0AAV7WS26_PLEWA|nr:hypothetical protein NDU88_003085 [Pleurodeles waltl]
MTQPLLGRRVWPVGPGELGRRVQTHCTVVVRMPLRGCTWGDRLKPEACGGSEEAYQGFRGHCGPSGRHEGMGVGLEQRDFRPKTELETGLMDGSAAPPLRTGREALECHRRSRRRHPWHNGRGTSRRARLLD